MDLSSREPSEREFSLTLLANQPRAAQVADGYAADTSVCQLPAFLGGTVLESSMCGSGTTVSVPAPDGGSDAAAFVTVFRWEKGGNAKTMQGHTGILSFMCFYLLLYEAS